MNLSFWSEIFLCGWASHTDKQWICPQVCFCVGSKNPAYSQAWAKSAEALYTLVLKMHPFLTFWWFKTTWEVLLLLGVGSSVWGHKAEHGGLWHAATQGIAGGNLHSSICLWIYTKYSLTRTLCTHKQQHKEDENLWLRSGVLLRFR